MFLLSGRVKQRRKFIAQGGDECRNVNIERSNGNASVNVNLLNGVIKCFLGDNTGTG